MDKTPLSPPALLRFAERRSRLAKALNGAAALLAAGVERVRTIEAVRYPFRPSSHVLFFCGALPPGAILLITSSESVVFLPKRTGEQEIWDGPSPSKKQWQIELGVDRVESLEALPGELQAIPAERLCSLPSPDQKSNRQICDLLGRQPDLQGQDRPLALAVIAERLCHDSAAVKELRRAAKLTEHSFVRAMQTLSPGMTRSAGLAVLHAETLLLGGQPAFLGAVTHRSEILHDESGLSLELPDHGFVLVDYGAESPSGYTSDVTRTWPLTGVFSEREKQLYMVVLEAQLAAITALRPGVRFLDVHMKSAEVLCQGLIELGILRGQVDRLVERGVHTLFYPHGIGHLVGLDVHDMEDLGDLAGYQQGRSRSEEFGLNALRLDRDLRPGMAVSIEPGCYFIPALLDSPERIGPFADVLVPEKLAAYRDLRGIRIEDTVLITEQGAEVLTAAIVKQPEEIEHLVRG